MKYVKALGWTEDSWDHDNKDPPSSNNKYWDELSDREKDAADNLCYFAELWDQSPLTIWKGIAWPEDRYWPWELLDDDERNLLQQAGWTKSTWNVPGSAPFEYTSWNSLPSATREVLEDWGFYHDQWNCYMNHYDDYDWFELVLEDVAQYFEAFGWNVDTWTAKTEEPWAWNVDWDELSDAQRDAAWEICYFRETWDDMPLSKWPESTRSGGPMNNVYRDDDSDGRPGLWISLVLLIVVVGGAGGYYYLKARDQRENFDPTTSPVKPPPIDPTEMDFSSHFSSPQNASDGEMQDVPTLT